MSESEQERRQRHFELLSRSRDALDAERDEPDAPTEPVGRTGPGVPGTGDETPAERRRGADRAGDRDRPAGDTGAGRAPARRYRGRLVRDTRADGRSAGPGAPGAPRAARGGGRRGGSAPGAPSGRAGAPGRTPGAGDDGLADALRRLTDLYRQGLITNEEYDRKRRELLDRL